MLWSVSFVEAMMEVFKREMRESSFGFVGGLEGEVVIAEGAMAGEDVTGGGEAAGGAAGSGVGIENLTPSRLIKRCWTIESLSSSKTSE